MKITGLHLCHLRMALLVDSASRFVFPDSCTPTQRTVSGHSTCAFSHAILVRQSETTSIRCARNIHSRTCVTQSLSIAMSDAKADRRSIMVQVSKTRNQGLRRRLRVGPNCRTCTMTSPAYSTHHVNLPTIAPTADLHIAGDMTLAIT